MDTPETTLYYVFVATALLVFALVLGYSYWLVRQKIRYYRLERQYFSAYLDGEETERKRVATDLHDDLLARLNSLVYHLREVTAADEASRERVQKTIQEIHTAKTWVRALVRHLGPVLLQQSGLQKNLESYIHSLPEHIAPRVILLYDVPRELPYDMSIQVFRIVQELLTNATKHSRARSILLRLKDAGSHLYIFYYDDGCGFEYKARNLPDGIGLCSLYSRTRVLGGIIRLHTRPGKGTKYQIYLPIKRKS